MLMLNTVIYYHRDESCRTAGCESIGRHIICADNLLSIHRFILALS